MQKRPPIGGSFRHLRGKRSLGEDRHRRRQTSAKAGIVRGVLLKERLRQINPAFVWENVDKYPSLEARTVTVDTAISRLKTIGGLTFTDRDENMLRSLRRTRNAIEHYEWRTTENEAKVIVGNALSFAISFAAEHLETDLAKYFKRDDTWRVLLEELDTFATAHGARIEATFRQKGEDTVYCDVCDQPTVPTYGGSCELCGHWQDVVEI
jgi:hypothetical protein